VEEYIVYGTYTKYITLRIPANSPEEALNQAMINYDYLNATEVEDNVTFEVLDTFISFDDVEES
jgi:hypothetical protein